MTNGPKNHERIDTAQNEAWAFAVAGVEERMCQVDRSTALYQEALADYKHRHALIAEAVDDEKRD